MFARLREANLLSTKTENVIIHWKVFDDLIVLILIVRDLDINTRVIDHCLDYIYSCLVVYSGRDRLITAGSKGAEHVKACIATSHDLIDYFLRLLITPSFHPNLLLSAVNTLVVEHETKEFIDSLTESYCSVTESDLTCLIVNGFLASASKGWWSRFASSSDSFLVVNLVNALASTMHGSTRQLSIFLPDNCPNEETRLVISQVYQNIFLVVLCGPEPSLESILESVTPLSYSQMHQLSFKAIQSMQSLPIDDKITSFLLINKPRKTLLKYGSLDHFKMSEIIAATVMTEEEQEYIKFKDRTAFRVESNDFVLIIFVSNDHDLRSINIIANQTLKQFSEKKKLKSLVN